MLVLGFAEMRVSPFKLCGIVLALGIVAGCIMKMAVMQTFNVMVCVCNSTVAALGTLKGPLEMAQVSVMRRVNSAKRPFAGKDAMHENIMDTQSCTEEQMQFLCDTTIPGARKFPLHDSALEALTSYFRVTSAADQKKLKKMVKKMSLGVHPDKNPHNLELAQQAFICLQASYETHTQLRALSWKQRADQLIRTWQQSAQKNQGPFLSVEEMVGIASICISFVFVLAAQAKERFK